jgi:hypothetical protein
MQDRLASNASKNNVASSSLGTLKAMFADLVQCRGPLLKIAKELDHRMEIVGEGKPVLIADLLLKAIPFEVTKRTSSKSEIAATFVKSWSVLSGIVANSSLSRELTHQLEAYLSLMGRLESTAEHAITEADEVEKNGKSIRLTGSELHRTMLKDRATKPIPAMSSCAKCGHCLVDEPFSNKETARLNKTMRDNWAKDHAQHEEYIKTWRNPLLDKNGKAVAMGQVGLGWVGSGPGRIRLGWVGFGRVGWGRVWVGLGWVGSGLGWVGLDRVGLDWDGSGRVRLG